METQITQGGWKEGLSRKSSLSPESEPVDMHVVIKATRVFRLFVPQIFFFPFFLIILNLF